MCKRQIYQEKFVSWVYLSRKLMKVWCAKFRLPCEFSQLIIWNFNEYDSAEMYYPHHNALNNGSTMKFAIFNQFVQWTKVILLCGTWWRQCPSAHCLHYFIVLHLKCMAATQTNPGQHIYKWVASLPKSLCQLLYPLSRAKCIPHCSMSCTWWHLAVNGDEARDMSFLSDINAASHMVFVVCFLLIFYVRDSCLCSISFYRTCSSSYNFQTQTARM